MSKDSLERKAALLCSVISSAEAAQLHSIDCLLRRTAPPRCEPSRMVISGEWSRGPAMNLYRSNWNYVSEQPNKFRLIITCFESRAILRFRLPVMTIDSV